MAEETNTTSNPSPGPEPQPEPPHCEHPKPSDVLREWGFDVSKFQTRAKQSLEGARGDLGEITGTLREALSNTKQVLVDLQKSRRPVAAELKTGFERAWDEIENAFNRARQRMREANAPKEAEPQPQAQPQLTDKNE